MLPATDAKNFPRFVQRHKVYLLNTFLKDISSESIYLLTPAPLDLINSSVSSSIYTLKEQHVGWGEQRRNRANNCIKNSLVLVPFNKTVYLKSTV